MYGWMHGCMYFVWMYVICMYMCVSNLTLWLYILEFLFSKLFDDLRVWIDDFQLINGIGFIIPGASQPSSDTFLLSIPVLVGIILSQQEQLHPRQMASQPQGTPTPGGNLDTPIFVHVCRQWKKTRWAKKMLGDFFFFFYILNGLRKLAFSFSLKTSSECWSPKVSVSCNHSVNTEKA